MCFRGSVIACGVAGLAVFAACNNTLGLAPPSSSNVVDTVTLSALDGTPLAAPSAYAIIGRTAVRTYQTAAFDFAFNFDSLGRAVFLPTGAIRFASVDTSAQPGFQYVSSTFDNTTLASTEGYEVNLPLVLDVTKVALARSRGQTCPDGTSTSLYAKLQVLAVDPAARTVRFIILSDQNCGYRGLAPGLPQQ